MIVNQLTIRQAIRNTAQTLEKAGLADARDAQLEARLMTARAAGISHKLSTQNGEKLLCEEEAAALDALLTKRLAGHPLQYLLGEWEFMGLPFKTDKRALIPRQDTETLVESALALIRARGYRACLDLCCGTGCIGIALAALGHVEVTLADLDENALSLARENAALNHIDASFLQTDMFATVTERYDLIACNPPYLCAKDMDNLQREVTFEPARALFGGADGLDFYRVLARDAFSRINPGGALVMEVGIHQAKDVAALFAKTQITLDLNGVERVVTAFQ